MAKRHFTSTKVFRTVRTGKLASVAASFALVICMTCGILFTGCSPKNTDSVPPYTPITDVTVPEDLSSYNTEYTTSTIAGYSAEYLGHITRNKPVKEIRDGGLASGYPKYGYTLSGVIGGDADKVAARNALISESSYLTATGTANAGGGNYKWMDKDGYLYNGTTAEPEITYDKYTNKPRQLYQHTASVGLYLGDVADNEPGIIKKVTMRPRTYNSYGVTGVYAPAGEVIKIEMSEADMEATGGIIIHIGQALYNGQANNIWADKGQMQRIPHLLNTMVVSKDTATLENGVYTAYVGSFIGGPLYIRNENVTFSATISGGVAYSHFILGYTTEAEFEMNAKSSAPYFDLEVWHYGVLHSGPVSYAKAFSYDDLYKAAVLWDKVSSVACTNGSNQGIVFLYDPFVAAGAAVAFPGRSSVNCPMGWMPSSLNYNAIVTSGSWGNFHEYHHNFQNFGIGYTGEVTNNALTLVSYSLFTKISAARQIEAYGGQGLGGWNNYTSASWALAMVNNNNIASTSGLAVYATLLHNFGQDAFINARGYSGVNYFNRWADITHQDFSYYASQVQLYAGVDYSQDASLKANDYPMFVPVASVYQTGRSYMYDNEKRYIETMQPYVIPYGAKFTVDLNPYTLNTANQYESGSVVIGNGFKYSIKSVDASKADGSFVSNGDGTYTFTPGSNEYSGKIYVTLEITTADGSHTYNGKQLNDVDLVLEFQQSHETNKTVLERTTYTYTEGSMYEDAREAYEHNFSGYQTVDTIDHTNPVQNSNTDIWYYPDTEANRTNYPDAPEHYFLPENTVSVLEGKLYFQEEGKYRIFLRGRQNCAVYYSLDGKNYTLGAYIADSSTSSGFRPTASNPNTYFDVELEAGSWVYFKEVLINKQINNNMASFIGLGVGSWTEPQYRIVEKFYDKDGNEVSSADDPNYDHSKSVYYDNAGNEVSEDVVNAAEKVPPTNASYMNAYRSDYEFSTGEFESDYFYNKKINYNYSNIVNLGDANETVYLEDSSNYTPWDGTDTYKIENLFDGDVKTGILGNRSLNVSEETPAYVTIDLGKEVTADTLILYPNTLNAACRAAFPKNFKLEGSLDGETFFEIGSWTDVAAPSASASFPIGSTTLRYYRFTVTEVNGSNPRLCLGEIMITRALQLTGNGDNTIEPDNAAFTYGSGWESEQAQSTFGHVYIGNAGSTVSFEFTGTRLAILSNGTLDSNFEVTIDGKKVNSVELKERDSEIYFSYLSEKLTSGKHTVVIKCVGKSCIDSFVTYDEG